MKAELGRKTRRSMSEINVVPYIDVMLVLLIIFMVTAPMITPSVIDLPSMSGSNVPKQTQPIEVTVKEVGQLTVKDLKTGQTQKVSLNKLAQTIKELQDTDTDRPVVIAAEKNIQYQAVVDAMDALQSASIAKVGLLVKPKGP